MFYFFLHVKPYYVHLPYSPARDTNTLNYTDHNLGHEDEKESHKVERAVTPAQRE